LNGTYNGWKNYETWNVVLWMSNDYGWYQVVKGHKKFPTPYLSFRRQLWESFQKVKTGDGVSLWDDSLDIQALDELINES